MISKTDIANIITAVVAMIIFSVIGIVAKMLYNKIKNNQKEEIIHNPKIIRKTDNIIDGHKYVFSKSSYMFNPKLSKRIPLCSKCYLATRIEIRLKNILFNKYKCLKCGFIYDKK